MKQLELSVSSNEKINKDVYLLTLQGDMSEIKNSGEFVELSLDGFYLNRPFSVCDYSDNELVILYKVLGQGTKELAKIEKHKFKALIGLGNGFDLSMSKRPLLIGGGIGIAPLYNLAKQFVKRGIRPLILLGFKNKEEVIFEKEFSQFGHVIITTDDGSYQNKGNTVTYLQDNKLEYDYYYACGPQVMLKNLAKYDQNGEISLEARMGCGFGACMGCSIKTTTGYKRVCKEGPVFKASEVLFDE